jgi:hypothetical protein
LLPEVAAQQKTALDALFFVGFYAAVHLAGLSLWLA